MSTCSIAKQFSYELSIWDWNETGTKLVALIPTWAATYSSASFPQKVISSIDVWSSLWYDPQERENDKIYLALILDAIRTICLLRPACERSQRRFWCPGRPIWTTWRGHRTWSRARLWRMIKHKERSVQNRVNCQPTKFSFAYQIIMATERNTCWGTKISCVSHESKTFVNLASLCNERKLYRVSCIT